MENYLNESLGSEAEGEPAELDPNKGASWDVVGIDLDGIEIGTTTLMGALIMQQDAWLALIKALDDALWNSNNPSPRYKILNIKYKGYSPRGGSTRSDALNGDTLGNTLLSGPEVVMLNPYEVIAPRYRGPIIGTTPEFISDTVTAVLGGGISRDPRNGQDAYGRGGSPVMLGRIVVTAPINEGNSNKSIWNRNYVKTGVSLVNALNAGRLLAGGIIRIGIGLGLGAETTPPSWIATGLGAVNINSSRAAYERSRQIMNEAGNERMSDGSLRNLWGLAPFGQYFDDPWEPTPYEFFKGKFEDFKNKPAVQSVVDFITEFGTIGG